MIALYPNYADAYNGRARAYHLRGDDGRALPDAMKAVALAPQGADSVETRGEIYERLGRRDDAIADYRAALNSCAGHAIGKGRADAPRRAVKGETVRKILLALGLLLAALPAFAQTSAADFAKCASADPDTQIGACTAIIQSGQDTGTNLAIDYYDRGIGYAAKGVADQAIADYSEAISLNPAFALAYLNRGMCYDAKGLRDQAIADYTSAIRSSPTSWVPTAIAAAPMRPKASTTRRSPIITR